MGKQYSLTTPPIPGPKCRGEIFNIYTRAKKIPIPWQKPKNLTTPPAILLQLPGKDYKAKFMGKD